MLMHILECALDSKSSTYYGLTIPPPLTIFLAYPGSSILLYLLLSLFNWELILLSKQHVVSTYRSLSAGFAREQHFCEVELDIYGSE
jgi:hypothetical protein